MSDVYVIPPPRQSKINGVFSRQNLSPPARAVLPGSATTSVFLLIMADGSYAIMPKQGQFKNAVVVHAGGMIMDRGRGPEIVGTRITIYTIMDFLKYNYSIPDIARELRLTEEQTHAAVDYIRGHQAESNREYDLIMERVNRPNPPEVERGCAKTPEELRERLGARREGKSAHDRLVGQ